MSTLKCCLDCSKCFQAEKKTTTEMKSWLCLLTRSPFTLRLMLLENCWAISLTIVAVRI